MNKILKNFSLYIAALLLTFSGFGLAGSKNSEENSPDKIYGKVIETMDSGSYTYVHVDSGEEKYWVASAPVTLDAGTMVSFGTGMPMTNFTSKTLDRTFDLIYFVGQIKTDKAVDHVASANTKSTTGSASVNNAGNFDVDSIKKAANGITIDQALTERQKLAGETVQIRGMVVKYTPKVMGKNWIHIRDSSSSIDLTVTTSGTVATGDVILVSGKLQLDRDFGYGYVYEVLLEDSTVTVE